MRFSTLSHALAASLISRAWAQEISCFAPDGNTLAPNETYVPCNKLGIQQAGVESSCCKLDGTADERDVCAVTGLCVNSGITYRAYCTDKTWNSPNCVNVCTDPQFGGVTDGVVEMTSCSDGAGSYCCGHNNLTCCGTDHAVTVPTLATVADTDLNNETGVSDAYKSATIALAVISGVALLACIGASLGLMRQNKSLKKQLAEKPEPAAAASAPAAAPPVMEPYRDSHVPGMGMTPMGSEYNYKPPPGSPPPQSTFSAEVHGTSQRYSELDASGIQARSEMGSPVPTYAEHNAGRHSPRPYDSAEHPSQ